MKKYTREQIEEKLKKVNETNKKDLEMQINKLNLNGKKEINYV